MNQGQRTVTDHQKRVDLLKRLQRTLSDAQSLVDMLNLGGVKVELQMQRTPRHGWAGITQVMHSPSTLTIKSAVLAVDNTPIRWKDTSVKR